ncbi:MAG: hypothetical protein NUK65_09810 [Firmicutes bacterium]|nr:hypothetical protein [Bacillota bacterium]
MKKTIVFIIDNYYPNYSAVGICANNIIEELSSKYKVIVIAKRDINSKDFIEHNNHFISKYSTVDNNIRNYIDSKIKYSKGIKRKIFLLLKNIVRGKGYLNALTKHKNIKNKDIQSIIKKIIDIEEHIDVIIPTCLPIESIMASIEYKNIASENTQVIPLLFDKFSENATLHRTERNKSNKFSRHLMIEKKLIDQSDKLIYVDSWQKHIDRYFSEHKNKFIRIEHPLIKEINYSVDIKYDNKKINIIYTGALYRKLRSPIRMLEVFENLIKNDDKAILHFYITGDCDTIIQEYSKKYPNNIIYYGKVKSEIAKSAIVNADILLSIGNTDTTQLPSKIFEYISTGNQIIHFFSEKEDPAIEILNRYGSAICIDNNDKDKCVVANLMEFINKQYLKINFNEIEHIYRDATPKYTADIIMNLIEDREETRDESTSS